MLHYLQFSACTSEGFRKRIPQFFHLGRANMKKNILYLSPSNRWLGARISLHVLLKMLDKSKYHPVIVCPSREGPFAQVLESDGFEVEYLRLWNWRKYKYLIHRSISVLRLRALVRKHNIHLIHCNEFWTAPYAYWSTIGMKIPIVSHVRLAMTSEKIRNYYLGKMWRIMCVCKALVEEFREWPDYKSRVIPIYNGVDLTEYDPESVPSGKIRFEYHIPDDALVIGLVGQISARKGQDRLIRIAPDIIRQCPNVRFLIVGSSREPDYENEIHRMIAEMNLGQHFIFTGARRDMPEVYRALDILVLPSSMEGFGRVVVEAEAMRIPVVASNMGGLVEVVDHGRTGFQFDNERDSDMSDALIRLCGDRPLREEMGRTGRDYVIENFTQEIMACKVTRLYEEVFAEARERSR